MKNSVLYAFEPSGEAADRIAPLPRIEFF